MSDQKRVFTPHAVDELLTGWLVHSHKARDRHDEASRKYAMGQYALGIPALVVSTVVGTSVFSALSSKEVPALWVALLSILAAVLTALQTFLDFGGRSDKHRSAAVKYKSSIRLIEEAKVQLALGNVLTKEEISTIRTMLDSLEETAPVVMPRIYDKVEKKYQGLKYVPKAMDLYNKIIP